MTEEKNNNGKIQGAQDFYFIINDNEHDFYWVLNLEDHPSSFLLDRNYQHFLTENKKGDQDSMIIIQPTA